MVSDKIHTCKWIHCSEISNRPCSVRRSFPGSADHGDQYEHTCSWASNTHSATAMYVSVYCGVSFMNIPSREQQTICQCVLTCVCIWSCVSVCVLNDIFRRTTKATQGGKWMGKSARLFMQPWQHNNETHSPCAPVQPVTSAPLAAQRPPLALRSHWEERHAERESDGAVLLSVASPDSIHPPSLFWSLSDALSFGTH